MVIVSAAVFHSRGIAVDTMEDAHRSLEPILGGLSSGAFGLALLASGLSSSAVGTLAGQTVMKGFIGLSIPIPIRRAVTMLPAFIVILAGVSPMKALLVSQVILSFVLPVPIIQMLYISGKSEFMGRFANSPRVRRVGVAIAFAVAALNVTLLAQTLFF